MLRVALRGLATRRLRAALTAVAIVLGVALVAGTFVLTDSITGAFNSIFSTIYQGTDATVTGRNVIDSGATGGAGGGNGGVPPFSQSLLARVQGLPGVKDAVGDVSGSLQLVVGGKAITSGGAPNLGFSVDPSKPQFSSLRLVSGTWPGPNDVVIDTTTASKKNLHTGGTVGVQGTGPVVPLRISGLVKFGSASSLGGATLAGLQLPTAQRLLGRQGKLDEIRAGAKPGVSSKQLVAQIGPILPKDTQVRTGAQQATKDSSSITGFLSFLKTFLLVFAGVALFVGSFVIANSLSITIAQRTREFATLRTLGASRRQVRRSILVESFVIGAVASVVGLLVGLALAQGLFALFNAAGLTLPNTGTVVKPRTIIVAIIVGVVVTVIASLRPAIRATRVEPIAAVREGATIPEGRLARYRFVMSAATAVVGVIALMLGLFVASGTGAVLILMGLGAVLIFIGVALLSARVVPRLATWLGWPATRIAGAIGELARDNTIRNPQRTASTASALMIGLALVTFVTVLSAGIIANFKGAVNDVFRGDYAITAQNNFSPIPISAGETAARAPGVVAVGDVRAGQGRVLEVKGAADRGQPDDRARRPPELEARLAGGAGHAGSRWCVRGRRLRVHQPSLGGLAAGRHHAHRRAHPARGQGDLQAAQRGLPVRPGDDVGRDVGPLLLPAREPVHPGQDGRRRDARQPEGAGPRHGGVPQRQGADARAVHQQPDLRAVQRAQHPLRAAGPVDRRQPVRDRQHAGAVGVRAHAGDRDAARRGDQPPPGPAHDPPRERDHRAHRLGPGDRAGDRLRRPAGRARQLSSRS